jgi:hypothetical protein
MSDYTNFYLDCNTAANDAATPVWTTQVAPGGVSGANEIRWCASGAGGSSTSSSNWPGFQRPASVQAVPELWACTANTTCAKVNTYDGTNSNARQFRWDFDANGTPVSPFQMSAFATTALPTPTAGSQPSSPSSDGSGIVNGQASDTSSTAYLKGNAYGVGLTNGGSQQTPSAGTTGTLAATSGTAGSVTPGASAWLATFQSLQGWTQYILSGDTAKATTAGYWYFVLALYSGPNLCLGSNIGPVIVNQYNYT